MPRRNIDKIFAPHSFYHVYNRGYDRQPIFSEHEDKLTFMSLLNRYLDPGSTDVDTNGQPYEQFLSDIELLSYCIMSNHYHLLFWLGEDVTAMPELMKCIGSVYTMKFNKKYGRTGPLFESRYKAVRIESDPQLMHITRYIHLNPSNPHGYPYSSIERYLNPTVESGLACLKPERILRLFSGSSYQHFLDFAEAV